MHEQNETSTDSKVVSNRTMDIVVALLFLGAASLVIADSVRLGFTWQENVGPAGGYFPFYVALVLAVASLVNLFKAILDRPAANTAFVTRSALARVLAVLVPLMVYAVVIGFIGIYVASTALIAMFMMYFGRYPVYLALPVGAAVAVALFVTFEIWFLVPLPKGPLEAYLGY